MHTKFYSFVLITTTLLVFIAGVDTLYCYRCLSLDCNEDAPECQARRAFIQAELKALHYIDFDLSPCPEVDDGHTWRSLQILEEPCEAEQAKEATCSLGRIAIKTIKGNTEEIGYGTVLGCAKRRLLQRTAIAHRQNSCDTFEQNTTLSDTSRIQFQVEHCSKPETECNDRDFCIDQKLSEVVSWGEESTGSKTVYIIGGVGLLFAVVIVLIFGVQCVKDQWLGGSARQYKVQEMESQRGGSVVVDLSGDEGRSESSDRRSESSEATTDEPSRPPRRVKEGTPI